MRRSVGGEPNYQEYQDKQAKLEEFKRLESEGILDLYYLDETGFCLIPCVPYGWQNIGEYLALPSSRNRRVKCTRNSEQKQSFGNLRFLSKY